MVSQGGVNMAECIARTTRFYTHREDIIREPGSSISSRQSTSFPEMECLRSIRNTRLAFSELFSWFHKANLYVTTLDHRIRSIFARGSVWANILLGIAKARASCPLGAIKEEDHVAGFLQTFTSCVSLRLQQRSGLFLRLSPQPRPLLEPLVQEVAFGARTSQPYRHNGI
jgi:hypothetical protein